MTRDATADASTPAAGAGTRGEIDWATVLVWLMRALSVAMILRGIVNWSVLIGVVEQNGTAFEDQPLALQVNTVVFSVLDLVAGVGLWIAAPWGGALWLIATMVLVIIDVAGLTGATTWAVLLMRPWPLSLIDVALVAIYLAVSMKAGAQVSRTDHDQRSRPTTVA